MAVPTKPVIGDVLAVRVYCKDGEQTSINTFHFLVTVVTTGGATYQEIADRFDAVLGVAFPAVLNNNAEYRGTGVKAVSFPNPPAEVFGVANAGPGVAGAVSLPRQTCGLISFYDGLSGRSHHGRAYLPFPATADNTADGVPTAGYVFNADVIALLVQGTTIATGAGGSTSMKSVLWHGLLVVPDQILTHRTRAVWATQRRRGSEGRPNIGPI